MRGAECPAQEMRAVCRAWADLHGVTFWPLGWPLLLVSIAGGGPTVEGLKSRMSGIGVLTTFMFHGTQILVSKKKWYESHKDRNVLTWWCLSFFPPQIPSHGFPS